jgi:hypothetical protein
MQFNLIPRKSPAAAHFGNPLKPSVEKNVDFEPLNPQNKLLFPTCQRLAALINLESLLLSITSTDYPQQARTQHVFGFRSSPARSFPQFRMNE